MVELLSLIGASGSGKILSMASEFMTNRAQAVAEEKEREFQRTLADKDQLKDYLSIQHQHVEGKPTLLSYTLCFLYLMFGATACAACLYCFYVGFGEVTIKDPDQEGGGFALGPLKLAFQAKSITDISAMGVGYLILHPILFILSMVSTSSRPVRTRI